MVRPTSADVTLIVRTLPYFAQRRPKPGRAQRCRWSLVNSPREVQRGVKPGIEALWGKTGERDRRVAQGEWHPLLCHVVDTTEVVFWLWDRVLGVRQRSLIAGDADLGVARRRSAALGGLHDLGKATPCFQVRAKNPARAAAVEQAGLSLAGSASKPHVLHALLSARFVYERLTAQGLPFPSAAWPALVVGGHHGSFPSSHWRGAGTRLQLGGAAWATARQELADLVFSQAGVVPADWDEVPSIPSQVATAGLVILADWLASNTDLFAYTSGVPADYLQRAQRQAHDIPTVLDIGRPWRPDATNCADVTVLFGCRWPGKPPRPIQELAHDLARRAQGTGLLVIEAPMGEGKSEAALAAAEVVAARCGSDGIFLGLPTQATANQQFARIKTWLKTFGQPIPTLALAHGKARRQEDYRKVLISGVDPDDQSGKATLAALDWLAGSKKALLAHVVVGTVDQLLLAGVAARHVALRHLALAGKVVIVDEVHAYDAYMSMILHRVLAWLGAEGVPVILLSATLPSQSRQELVSAYGGISAETVDQGSDYPRLTWVDAPTPTPSVAHPVTATCPAWRSSTALCEFREETGDDGTRVAEWAFTQVKDGGCLLIIRNTVARAQKTFAALRRLMAANEITLVHAAFTAADRRRLDKEMTSKFGPPDENGTSSLSRPVRHIVVATQVLEQSLDVDFDVLITDLAPIDLLLQRLGRVCRHARNDRAERFVHARMIVVGFEDRNTLPPAFPTGSVAVYGEYLLARTAAVLMQGAHSIRVPDDVPLLVDAVYSDEQVGPDTWQQPMAQLAKHHEAEQKKRRESAHGVLLALPTAASLEEVGYGSDQPPEDGDSSPLSHVRYGPPSVEVLVLRKTSEEHVVRAVSKGMQQEFSLVKPPAPSMIDALLDQTVRLPHSMNDAVQGPDDVSRCKAWSWSPWLSKLRVLLLNADNSPTQIGNRLCAYSTTKGFEVLR